ncbi:FHA domain-containing protein [Fimbriiglobus ruber]|uniref:FHA domain containing protein n=1 Tax=Fimbriiglobus ruber TaxID=1908690 RepID=A0A225ECL7_9BACT|nr:FHA domain-containing protein [Fimbriiglobus ruber]OWK47079.1 FHA domain containing protein [Fimbriiglobus ruber]
MRVRLVPIDKAPQIELTKDLTLVGRNEDCDVRIDHKSISKLHCILVKTDGLILVRDLGSTNGTRVNGLRVRRAALLPNDNLAIAAFKYKVKFGDTADDRPAAGTPDVAVPMRETSEDDDLGAEKLPGVGTPLRRNALPDAYPDAAPKS